MRWLCLLVLVGQVFLAVACLILARRDLGNDFAPGWVCIAGANLAFLPMSIANLLRAMGRP